MLFYIMRNHLCVLLNVMYSLLEVSKSQYVIVNRKVNKINQCDPNNALVEQFFNIIFAEFHRSPPVCVCVQMCTESPTYCYPNGCLRSSDRIIPQNTTTSAPPVNRIQYDSRNPTKSVMFLVDDDKDLIDNIFVEPRINSHLEKREKPLSNEIIFSPNPFRELVFKYRKVPKLEMRYNLREKVKNTKSDKIKTYKLDMSKTRWSMNKQILNGKQLLNRIGHYKKDDDRRTFFASMFPATESVSTNKKYLSKREDNSGLNVDALYIYKTDVANFSVENVIDDLIINSLHDNKDNMKSNKKMQFDETVLTTTESYAENTNENLIETTVTNNFDEMTTADTIYINFTHTDNKISNSNLLKNNKTYQEEIATMSEKIEKNNNTTIELVRRITEQRSLENDTTTNISVDVLKTDIKSTISNASISKVITESNKKYGIMNAAKRWTNPFLKTKLNQKRRQRLTCKLNHKLY